MNDWSREELVDLVEEATSSGHNWEQVAKALNKPAEARNFFTPLTGRKKCKEQYKLVMEFLSKKTSLGEEQITAMLHNTGSKRPLEASKAKEEGKKRVRRTAVEIRRDHACPKAGCKKAYGSDGALKMHIKLKHKELYVPKMTRSLSASYDPDVTFQRSKFGEDSILESSFSNVHNPPPVTSTPTPTATPATSSFKVAPAKQSVHYNYVPEVVSNSTTVMRMDRSELGAAPGIQPAQKSSPPIPRDFVEVNSLKCCNMPVLLLKIGAWRKLSSFCGDVLARFDFFERVFAWEIFSSRAEVYRMQVPFDTVSGMCLETFVDGTAMLMFEVSVPPKFSFAPLQPHRGMSWMPCDDFTAGNASTYQMHMLHFPRGSLIAPLDSLLQEEPRLKMLALKGISMHPEVPHPTFRQPAFASHPVSGDEDQRFGEPPQDDLKYPFEGDYWSCGTCRSSPCECGRAEQAKSPCPSSPIPSNPPPTPFPQGIVTVQGLSDCAKMHLRLLSHLDSQVLHQEWGLFCCALKPTLKDLLRELQCKCGFTYTYSFCLNKVVQTKDVWHCKDCKVCRDRREWHCSNCNRCVSGITSPCPQCASKTKDFNDCNVQ